MGMPVVVVASGGLAVTNMTNGTGLPCDMVSGYGIPVTHAPNGMPVSGVTLGGVLWTPASLGAAVVAAQYDASIAASITAAAGVVSGWNDLSGNANHLTQPVGAEQPLTGSAGINSLNAISFDGTNDTINRVAGVAVLPSNDSATLLAVRRHKGGTSGGIAGFMRTASSNDVYKFGRDAGAFVAGGNGTSSAASTQATVADADNTNPILWSATFAQVTTRREIFKNGTSVATNTSAITAQAAPDKMYVGAMFNAARGALVYANMDLGELIVLVGNGATNRQRVEGYLAHKWGLVAVLDVGHPYKSAPPYV